MNDLTQWNELMDFLAADPMPSPWISVADRLPEPKQYVLGHRDGDMWVVAFWNGNWWTDPQTDHCDVTHWMPLPPPPEIRP